MNKTGKVSITLALIVIIGIVIAFKSSDSERAVQTGQDQTSGQATDGNTGVLPHSKDPSEKLPHLVDLGADKCIPCKMMKPILAELQQNFTDQFKVTFIDVWENPDQSAKYGIKIIPTQIFYDASGKELFRHEGFYSKEDILGKWNDLGVKITNKNSP